MAELAKHDLLMEGEVTIQRDGGERPFVYRGFQMINENKLSELRGDVLRDWNQTGLLSPVFAHLHSLGLLRDIFTRQNRLVSVASRKQPRECHVTRRK